MVNSFFVDVKGAVKQPGVYEFLEGDKVIDAIKQAGGLTSNAYTSNINLSKKLSNEMVVYVFKKSEITTPTTTANNPCNCETIQVDNCINKEENTSSSKVNINTADVNILSTLSGIGEAKAKAIIDYRTQNGLFKTIEDIKNVSGLGDSLFAKIKDSITV
jgi:competence protein ComEA